MKRSWLITILICLLLLCGGGAVLLLPQVVPFDQCSDVYKRYADMDGVDATFIKDYKVNDTVFVDVTLLETKDTARWDSLCRDFGIALFSMYQSETSREHSFSYRLIKDTITTGLHSVIKKDLVVFSQSKMSMCIFHDVSNVQYVAIINKEYEKINY